MNKKLLWILIYGLLLGCNQEKVPASNSLDYIPADCFALIKINNFTAFSSDLRNNNLLNAWDGTDSYERILEQLAPLQYLRSDSESILGFYHTGKGKIEYLIASPYSNDIFTTEKSGDISHETVSRDTGKRDIYQIDGKTLYSVVVDSFWLLSTSDSLLNSAVTKPAGLSEDPVLKSLYSSANPERNATLFIQLKPAATAFETLLNPIAQTVPGKFANWMSADIGMQQNYLSLSGIALPNDSLMTYADLFRNTNPLPLLTPSYAPGTAKAVTAFSLGDYRSFASRRESYNPGTVPKDSLFNAVEEVGVILEEPGTIVLLNTYGSDDLSEYFGNQSTGSITYRDHEIYELPPGKILSEHFSPLITDFEPKYYTILDNSLIFSDQSEALFNLLNHHNLGSTFDKTPLYISARESLADESNILLVAGEAGMRELLRASLGETLRKDLQNTDLSRYSFSAQLVAEGSFYHTALIIKRLDTADDNLPVSTRFTIELDAPIATDPQFVKNHRTNQLELVVQDEDNNLYLIGTDGKVLWKKQLEGRIQGAITQVDLYRNGRLQLAFTTDNQFIILDRNGKEVPPFKMAFPGGNLNPLAVFDYDSNRNYRFLVTRGNEINMYNNDGKIVRGFTYTRAESPVLPPPQHIRFGKRDYLVFRLENGDLKILNRVGRTRIPVEEKIDFSGNGVYAYNNQFALTGKDGTLYMINEKGAVTKAKLDLNQDHGMKATAKSMALMNENILTIKGKEVSLDYGVYTAPRIFYIYDTIYVGVTDIQSQRMYLFDSNAEAIPGFPVFGSSTADLGDMDNDRHLELVTRMQDNALIVYRLK